MSDFCCAACRRYGILEELYHDVQHRIDGRLGLASLAAVSICTLLPYLSLFLLTRILCLGLQHRRDIGLPG
jgi:hypothetical protein